MEQENKEPQARPATDAEMDALYNGQTKVPPPPKPGEATDDMMTELYRNR